MRKEYMIKQRGLFDRKANKPFKISRSQIEAFLSCPRCFWMNHRRGLRQPSGPPFLINSLVDHNLKCEFDQHRAEATPHPIMLENGIDAVPFAHPDIDIWRNNFRGMQWLDEKNNLLITGAVDDIWQRRDNGKLIIVDYKATAKEGEVTLDDEWKLSYKRQMEIYTWLLRKLDFSVEDRGYFLYANGRRRERFDGKLHFDISLLPYDGATDWISPTIADLKRCLLRPQPPKAPHDCEYCGYIAAVGDTA